jgi:uncharacterized protein (TIGR03067 family)
MTRWLVALLVLVPLPVLADQPDPEPPARASQFDGEWELVLIRSNGREHKVAPGSVTMILAKGKMTRKLMAGKGGTRDIVYTYKIDARKSPAHLDMTMGGRTTHAICKVSGNELLFTPPHAGMTQRPKDFESAQRVSVYRRKKK